LYRFLSDFTATVLAIDAKEKTRHRGIGWLVIYSEPRFLNQAERM